MEMGGWVPPTAPRSPQEVACSREDPGSPYLRDELEEGVGVEGSNRQSYEVEQEPLVKSLLHEGHNAGPQEGAEGDDGHAEETVPPHCHGGGEPAPPGTGTRANAPGHGSHHWGKAGGGCRGGSSQEGFGGQILTKETKEKNQRETSREGERNRTFISDSSLLKFSSIKFRRNGGGA